jgi:hypothetical protein
VAVKGHHVNFEPRILPLLGILLGIGLAIYGGQTQGGFSRVFWLGSAFAWASLASLLLWLGWDLMCSRKDAQSIQETFSRKSAIAVTGQVMAYALAGMFGSLVACSLSWVAAWTINSIIESTSAVGSIGDYLSFLADSIALLISPLCGLRYILIAALILGAAVGGIVGLCKAIDVTDS